jgi:hypothetical protein
MVKSAHSAQGTKKQNTSARAHNCFVKTAPPLCPASLQFSHPPVSGKNKHLANKAGYTDALYNYIKYSIISNYIGYFFYFHMKSVYWLKKSPQGLSLPEPWILP